MSFNTPRQVISLNAGEECFTGSVLENQQLHLQGFSCTGAQMVQFTHKSMQPSIGITARPMALVYERSGKKSARARRMAYLELRARP